MKQSKKTRGMEVVGRVSCNAARRGGGVVSVGFVLVVHKNKNRGTRPVVLISVA